MREEKAEPGVSAVLLVVVRDTSSARRSATNLRETTMRKGFGWKI